MIFSSKIPKSFGLILITYFLLSCSTPDTETSIVFENKTDLDLKEIKVRFCKEVKYFSVKSFEKSKTHRLNCSGDSVSVFAKLMQPGPLPFRIEIREIDYRLKQNTYDFSEQIEYGEVNLITISFDENTQYSKNDTTILNVKVITPPASQSQSH